MSELENNEPVSGHDHSNDPTVGDDSATPPPPRSAEKAGQKHDIDAEFSRLVDELNDIPGFAQARNNALGPRDWSPEVSDDLDEFVPPDPELDLQGDPAKILGWVLVAIGIAAMVLSILLAAWLPRIVFGAGSITTIIGVLLLLWRLPNDRNDPWDDGARV